MKKNKQKLLFGTCLAALALLIAGCQQQGGGNKEGMSDGACPQSVGPGKDKFIDVFIDSNDRVAINATQYVVGVKANDKLQWKRKAGHENTLKKIQVTFEEKGELCQSSPEVIGTNPCNNWGSNTKEGGSVNCNIKFDVACPGGVSNSEFYDYCYSIRGWDSDGNEFEKLDPVARGRR